MWQMEKTTRTCLCIYDVLLQFILRSEVMKLYRNMLRTIKKIPDKQQQKEMIEWVRHDFTSNQHLQDEVFFYVHCICNITLPFLSHLKDFRRTFNWMSYLKLITFFCEQIPIHVPLILAEVLNSYNLTNLS